MDLDNAVAVANHSFTITASHGGIDTALAANLVVPDTATETVPVPWQTGNFEGVKAGTATVYSAGSFALTAANCCFWGSNDAGRFAMQPFEGDGSVVARVSPLSWTFSLTEKAGISLRSHLGTASAHVSLYVQNNADIVMQVRNSELGPTAELAKVTGIASPRWLKLERTGVGIAGYYSSDGVVWTQVGSAIASPLPGRGFAGITVSPEYNPTTWSVTFTDVTVQSEWTP